MGGGPFAFPGASRGLPSSETPPGASRGLTFNTIRHHRTSSDAIAFSLARVHFEARQGSSPSLSGTSRPVSRILSDGDHPSEARRCRWAPATYPETSREQRSDGFRGQRTGLLGLAPGGVYRAAPVTRRTGGLLHHRNLAVSCSWFKLDLVRTQRSKPFFRILTREIS